MFEDWSRQLAAVDVAKMPERQVRALLGAAALLQSALDAFVARGALRLGDASAVRGATRCTQREADQAVARGETLRAIPEAGAALAAGEIAGSHVDVLARAAQRTSLHAVASGDLLAVAKSKPADAMRQQVTDFVRIHASDTDLAARHARQIANRRATLNADGDMGVLHAEFDDITYADVKAALDAETDRLFHADGGRGSAGDIRTPRQRRADALAALILGTPRASSSPPAVRNQAILVVNDDGTGHIPGVGPLPKAEIERLLCISDLHGIVFSADGQPLWMGDTVRLATDDQWRALVARDGGCLGCGAEPSRCEAHHIRWVRHNGPTDIDNLALVCKHHHHLIHDKNWQVRRGADGRWTLAPP